VATKGMLGDLNPLGDGPCCGLADHGARVPEVPGIARGEKLPLATHEPCGFVRNFATEIPGRSSGEPLRQDCEQPKAG